MFVECRFDDSVTSNASTITLSRYSCLGAALKWYGNTIYRVKLGLIICMQHPNILFSEESIHASVIDVYTRMRICGEAKLTLRLADKRDSQAHNVFTIALRHIVITITRQRNILQHAALCTRLVHSHQTCICTSHHLAPGKLEGIAPPTHGDRALGERGPHAKLGTHLWCYWSWSIS